MMHPPQKPVVLRGGPYDGLEVFPSTADLKRGWLVIILTEPVPEESEDEWETYGSEFYQYNRSPLPLEWLYDEESWSA